MTEKFAFILEADHRAEVKVAMKSAYPESHVEALTWFDKFRTTYRCVWLSEYGEYLASGVPKRDWIWYRWTEETGWGDNHRFTGYPEVNPYELVDYYAIDRKGARVS